MKFVVAGSASSYEELKGENENIEWVKVSNVEEFSIHKDADAFFNLDENAAKAIHPQGLSYIFINSVVTTLKEITQSKNMIRINGWKGFLTRSTWEVVADRNTSIEKILAVLGKKPIYVGDEPGLISARIISMIINEAYYAIGDHVSTEEQIDIAMKLGTNYPKGPFEWANEIGCNNVFSLLDKLKEGDTRYLPAPLLQIKSLATL